MAGLRLAECAVAFHLCLLRLPPLALRQGGGEHGRPCQDQVRLPLPARQRQELAERYPNGPMYHNGLYHFYQYNPDSVTWGNGNLSWGHSVSVDLVNWFALDTALEPTRSFDANGYWSGSATVLPYGRPVMLYTGIDVRGDQLQNVAFPKKAPDPLLVEWVKPEYNPVIPVPDLGDATPMYQSKDFLR